MVAGGGLEPSKWVSRLRPDCVLTTVGVKWTYQNLELGHVMVDMVKVGS